MTASPVRRVAPGVALVASYQRSWWRADVLGGVTVWAMLVPQSLGYAVLAGLPPVVGLYAAIGSLSLYWLWGSSRHLNVGAESTVAIMIATILAGRAAPGSDDYVDSAATLAILVGLVLIAGGAFRLGRIADFLSRPVLAGYVFGSGVLIVTSQIQGFLGTSIDPEPFLTDAGAALRNLDQADLASVAFGVASLIVVIGVQRYTPAVPGALVAVVGSMVVVAIFDVDVAVVGEFAGGIPAPGLPQIGWTDVGSLIGPAFAIALLVYPDSVLTARSLTASTPDRVDADQEFFGVGAANIGAGLMGAFPVNGSQSRSFVLAGTGARSQVANLVAAVLVLVTLGFLAPVFDWLPTSTLAAIVMVAGFGLLDLGELRNLWRFRRSEFLLAISTIGAVLAFGMLAGIVVAIGLSLLVVVLRAATPNTAVLGRVPGTDTFRDVAHHHDAALIPGILVYRFDAPLFFANAPGLRDEIIRHLADGSTAISNESPSDAANSSSIDTVVIDMEAVYDVDSTGVEALLELLDALDRSGIGLELARVRTHVRQDLEHAGIRDRLAGTGIHLEVDDAVDAFLERRRDP